MVFSAYKIDKLDSSSVKSCNSAKDFTGDKHLSEERTLELESETICTRGSSSLANASKSGSSSQIKTLVICD
ncbi:hypothetical protein OGATHE_005370 [Ogataea polymorpha]|uniref:Uncharacterized protein n=1 Tax=Ogataea polymorpha TaxID=460523 RepID=A0A9P8SZS9_9ASCO|nr:hypothetical protein OGATHE_005370 [Ogataea polymorpha]